jgi:hypothetical protein
MNDSSPINWPTVFRQTLCAVFYSSALFASCAMADALTDSSAVTNLRIDPPSPNVLKAGDNVTVSFQIHNYIHHEGVTVFVQPYFNKKPVGQFSPSPIYLGTAYGISDFTAGPRQTVNRLRVFMADKDAKETLFEVYVPVNFKFVASLPPE